jgi:hypothetical protein
VVEQHFEDRHGIVSPHSPSETTREQQLAVIVPHFRPLGYLFANAVSHSCIEATPTSSTSTLKEAEFTHESAA